MKIEKNKVVSMDYTLKNDAGEVVDTSEGRGPLNFIQGIGNIIAGLEKALEGKSEGEQVQVTVNPDEAYGQRNPQMVQEVPRAQFDGIQDIKIGQHFQVDTSQGPMVVTVTKVAENEVTIDANHPLAGETLHFDITIKKIREATQEELDHGHVHDGSNH